MRSHRPFHIVLLLFLAEASLFPASSAYAAAPEDHPAVPAILDCAESLFQSMKTHDYPAIFAALSAKSRETIVAETTSALAAATKQAPPVKPAVADAPHATPSEAPQGGPGANGAEIPAPARDPAPGPEAVRADFASGGPIARDYWNAFLRRFDPNAALEHSRWQIGSVGKDRAEILITHHGAEHPATLKMFREDGGWKAGLVETFWSR